MHGACEIDIVLKSGTYDKINLANTEHDNQTRDDNGGSGQQAAPYIACSCIAYICGTVDADRTGSYLADGQDIHELLLCHPTILLNFVLDKRENSQSTAKTEKTNLQEAQK